MATTLTHISKSMSGRQKILSEENGKKFPGPGAYNPTMAMTTSGWRMGNEIRLQQEKTSNAKVPGPGTQDMRKTTGFESPKWSMSKDKRNELGGKSWTPGPGNYEIKSRLQDAPLYSFGGKTNIGEYKQVEVNGPGAYNPD